MRQEKPLRTNERDLSVMLEQTSPMRRPIPLFWGIAAFFLFVGFAVVTQVQFKRIYNDKIEEARIESYDNAVKAYDAAVQAYETCATAIETRETYRQIFDGIELMFERTAYLPVDILPDSEEAVAYKEQMLSDITNLITYPIEEKLPLRRIEDCPKLPTEAPERP